MTDVSATAQFSIGISGSPWPKTFFEPITAAASGGGTSGLAPAAGAASDTAFGPPLAAGSAESSGKGPLRASGPPPGADSLRGTGAGGSLIFGVGRTPGTAARLLFSGLSLGAACDAGVLALEAAVPLVVRDPAPPDAALEMLRPLAASSCIGSGAPCTARLDDDAPSGSRPRWCRGVNGVAGAAPRPALLPPELARLDADSPPSERLSGRLDGKSLAGDPPLAPRLGER